MNRKHEIADDDGNIINPPSPDSDVMQLIYLLEYGRTRGFKIGPTVQIGTVIVQVADIRQAKMEHTESAQPDLDPESDMAVILAGRGAQ